MSSGFLFHAARILFLDRLIVTVMENEDKVDPLIPNPNDRMTKLRSQQEVHALLICPT